MKPQKRAIHDYLEDILRYTEKAQRFVADVPSFDAFAEDEMRVMATIRALEVIGEAVKHIPHSLRRKYPEVPWQEIAGMRDILIHGCYDVEDVATGLLMGKAYELLQAGVGKAAALRKVQLWMRDLTAAQAQEILEAQAAAAGQPTREVALTEMTRMALAQLLPVQRRFALMDDTERLFAHPYFWAAFQCAGV
jgi:Uncharacterized conserved protein, COG2361